MATKNKTKPHGDPRQPEHPAAEDRVRIVKPANVRIYKDQQMWLRLEAARLSAERGIDMESSALLREIIDAAMKKGVK